MPGFHSFGGRAHSCTPCDGFMCVDPPQRASLLAAALSSTYSESHNASNAMDGNDKTVVASSFESQAWVSVQVQLPLARASNPCLCSTASIPPVGGGSHPSRSVSSKSGLATRLATRRRRPTAHRPPTIGLSQGAERAARGGVRGRQRKGSGDAAARRWHPLHVRLLGRSGARGLAGLRRSSAVRSTCRRVPCMFLCV